LPQAFPAAKILQQLSSCGIGVCSFELVVLLHSAARHIHNRLGHVDVGARRRRIAGRMVMNQDYEDR
jgi:hypothetical protein